jgi:hypothetical protein
MASCATGDARQSGIAEMRFALFILAAERIANPRSCAGDVKLGHELQWLH